MTFTYSAALASDLHWVRRLINDTVESKARLQDEELTALLAQHAAEGVTGAAARYLAAADALELMASLAGGQVREKRLGPLSVSLQGGDASSAVNLARTYRIRAADILSGAAGDSPYLGIL